ncbi:hypothetical protein [Aureimonas psammosilenae]|uniref:hypothetical protein n=1 Tax=Aureimonas psammosilenae TaxID=2495496 RepID=UPI00126052FF|nr:hypothetical protein [Aureimonas psammosilenae]
MSRMDPQDARQGRKGTPVLRILIIALVLAVIAGIGMAIYGSVLPDQTLPEGGTGSGVTSPSQSSATPPASNGSVVTPQTSGPSSSGDTAN